MNRPMALLLALLLGSFALACGSGGGEDAATAPARTVEPSTVREIAPQLPVTVQDKDGKNVTVKDVTRIIPLNGDIAEIIASLDLQKNVVGADLSATMPSDYQKLPSIGYQRTLSAEGIISLNPTVIIGNENAGPPEVIEQIRAVGIPVVILKASSTLESVPVKIKQVGAALGVPNRGNELAASVQKEITEATTKAATAKSQPNVMFLYLRGNTTQVIMGEGSGADALIKAANAKDAGVTAGVKGTKPVTPESLVAAQPEVFLVLTAGLESVGGVDGLLKIPGVAQTPAGQNRKVVHLNDQYLLGFNSQAGKALMDLVKAFHPELG
jgi:iron complex transport system substrate-binding protein